VPHTESVSVAVRPPRGAGLADPGAGRGAGGAAARAAPVERPRALRHLAELLYDVPIDYPSLAHEMGLNLSFIQDLLEAHAAGT
jgi:hypothetical protein